MKLIFLLAFSIVSFLSTGEEHRFYVSHTTIEQDRQGTQLQITLKLFTDDLENALGDPDQELIHLGESDEIAESDSMIEDYLRKQFVLEINAEPIQWIYIGKEVELDLSWVYLEYNIPSAIHTLEVKNAVFMELFEEQTNIVQVDLFSRSETLTLSNQRRSEVISY